MENITTSIQSIIYEIRGQRVMLDRDLAKLYEVEVKRLNEAVKRNIERFPPDFMFQLTQDEWDNLRSQIATANEVAQDKGDILRSQFVTANQHISKVRFLPYVFTEQGIAMLSGLLNSETAISVNIQIMRAFVQLRHYMLAKSDTNEQIAEIRKLLMLHIENSDHKFSEHDEAIEQIVLALNNLIGQPKQTKRIGFNIDPEPTDGEF